jgi:hypothetical protein
MPLQSRVTPFGDLLATTARGTLMGNRGGRLHDPARKLGARRWASKQWICCKLTFNDRHRKVWGDSYTELFFLDEVTAFAAGHRPCFECRREDANRFAELCAGAATNSARPRERPLRRLTAAAMDDLLHAERLDGKAKRMHRFAIDGLPDGAMIARDGEAFAVRGGHLLRWSPSGYVAKVARPKAQQIDLLTPPSILKVLAGGYEPRWHESAG